MNRRDRRGGHPKIDLFLVWEVLCSQASAISCGLYIVNQEDSSNILEQKQWPQKCIAGIIAINFTQTKRVVSDVFFCIKIMSLHSAWKDHVPNALKH